MVSDRLGVKRHTAYWNVGELCNMSDWQYSMTLAQIYNGRITVTKLLVPPNAQIWNSRFEEQSYWSFCKITKKLKINLQNHSHLLFLSHASKNIQMFKNRYTMPTPLTCCMASSSSSFLLTLSPSTLSSWNLNWRSLSEPPKRLSSPKHWRWERERYFIHI